MYPEVKSTYSMCRMANIDEYKCAIVFLYSNASSYMSDENMIIDGGKSVW